MRINLFGLLAVLAILLTACAPQAISTATTAPVALVPATSVPSTSIPPTSIPASLVPTVSGNEVKVSISGYAFDPATITIKVGQTVTWTNMDSVGHTVVADDKSWFSNDLAQGASFSHTFSAAGTFAYHCGVHPTMIGTVIVQP